MSKRFIALAFAIVGALVTLELYHKKNGGGADDNNLRRALASAPHVNNDNNLRRSLLGWTNGNHVLDPKSVQLRDQAPLGHSNNLVVQGQLYTSQDVITSIDRVNNCPAHPVRCRDGIMELAVQLGQNSIGTGIGHVAEIGVFQGKFSRYQALTWLPNSKSDAIYHLIDAWQFRPDDRGVSAKDKNYRDDSINQENMRLTEEKMMSVPGMHRDRFKLHREFSIPAANLFPDEYFDYIYVDALHTYDAAYADMVAYWPKLKHGGVFAGDDFGDVNKKDGVASMKFQWGVRSAARQFAQEMRLPLYTTISPQHQDNFLFDGSQCYPFPAWYIVKPALNE